MQAHIRENLHNVKYNDKNFKCLLTKKEKVIFWKLNPIVSAGR